MKFLLIISSIIAVLSYSVVVIMYKNLSFIDTPYLILGFIFTALSLIVVYKMQK